MLTSYGWDDAFQRDFDLLNAPDLIPARVTVQQRGRYDVISDAGELEAQVSGRFAFEAEAGAYPVAGDWVALAARPEERAGTIQHVLPRRTVFQRKAPLTGALQVAAANFDVALLVQSLNADISPRRLERYLATARETGARPLVVLTKADICEDVAGAIVALSRSAGDAPLVPVSAVTGEGMEALRGMLRPGETAALFGSSGVGKSTLLNALAGEKLMLTREIIDDKRGRHTTTHRELILLPSGTLLLDSPGMRELGLYDAGEGVSATFADVEALFDQCRFKDCRHRSEPGCAVREAMESGELEEARWSAYQKLQREAAFEARKEDPRLRSEHYKMHMARAKNYRAGKKLRERQLGDDDD